MSGIDDWDELGPPEVRPLPGGRRKLWIAIGVTACAAVLLALGGLGVWALMRGGGGANGPSSPRADSTDVVESFVVSGPVNGDATAVIVPPPASAPAQPPPTPVVAHVPRIAYRLEDALWVADENGGQARKVAASKAGVFALSPDGKSLAFVDAPTRQLAIADVASARVTTVGAADVEVPVWAPASDWMAFVATTSGQRQVRRTGRDGRGQRLLGAGSRPAVAPDGKTFAFVSETGKLMLARGGAEAVAVPVTGRIEALTLTADRVLYAVGGSGAADLSIHSAGYDGKGGKRLVGPPPALMSGRYDHLMLSPSHLWLAYALVGDDGYSRLRAIRLEGTGDIELSRRRDGYPLGWSADSSRVFFIDGNADQGQETDLLSVKPDGTGRGTIVAGAGL